MTLTGFKCQVSVFAQRLTDLCFLQIVHVVFVFFFYSDMRCAGTGGNVLMSPEQGVFGYGSIDLLAGDEDDDVFNP